MPREEALLKIFYLAAAVLFIFGIKGLSHPRTAVRGNLLAALGMLLAIVVTLTDKRIVSFQIIVAGIVVGGLVGVLMAYRALARRGPLPQQSAIPQRASWQRTAGLFSGIDGLPDHVIDSIAGTMRPPETRGQDGDAESSPRLWYIQHR